MPAGFSKSGVAAQYSLIFAKFHGETAIYFVLLLEIKVFVKNFVYVVTFRSSPAIP